MCKRVWVKCTDLMKHSISFNDDSKNICLVSSRHSGSISKVLDMWNRFDHKACTNLNWEINRFKRFIIWNQEKRPWLPDVKKQKNVKNKPTFAQILFDRKYDSLYISSWMRPTIQTPVAATSKATAINDTITKQRDQWGLWSFPHFRKISFHKFFRIPAGFCFTANLLQAVKN